MEKSDFLSVLSSYRDLLWPVIEICLKRTSHFTGAGKIDQKYQPLIDFHSQMVSDYPQRKGKYLRPSLLMLTAQAMGVSLEKTLHTAAAMQLSEDWILNHDDIEDSSLQRRGRPTLHRIYGLELAINAGDALHALTWHVLNDNLLTLGPSQTEKINNEFFSIINRTILGQTIEIKWTKENKNDLTENDIYLILESKTGYYTISGPMRLGAILAKATPDQLESIYRFGLYLGRSFQIIDDLLDLTSDFSGQKKQKGNDVYEGKKTLIIIHLLHNIGSQNKEELLRILSLSRSQKKASDIKWVIQKMAEFGSLDYAKTKAQEFAKKASKIFDTELLFLSTEPYRSQLRSAIEFIINRQH